MNVAYKIKETRPYWKARGGAVLISTLLSLLITAILAALLAADYFARVASLHIAPHPLPRETAWSSSNLLGWTTAASACWRCSFAMIYYWAPVW